MSKENRADVNDCPLSYKHYFAIMGALALDKALSEFDFDDMIDLACIEENNKCKKGITKEQNSLDPKWKWHEMASVGWLASPYEDKIKNPFKDCEYKDIEYLQPLFVKKAYYESMKGMKIIALIQNSFHTGYYEKYIFHNENCDIIPIYGHLDFLNMGSNPSRGSSIVVFGVKRGSISQKTKDFIGGIPSMDKEFEYVDYDSLYVENYKADKKRSYVKSGKYTNAKKTKKSGKKRKRRDPDKISLILAQEFVKRSNGVRFEDMDIDKACEIINGEVFRMVYPTTNPSNNRIKNKLQSKSFRKAIRKAENDYFSTGHEQLDGSIEKRSILSEEVVKSINESDGGMVLEESANLFQS